MKNVLLFISLFLFSLAGISQEFEIRGVVTDADLPLQGAVVQVEGSNRGTSTNEEGYYSLSLKEGSYNLIFSLGNRKVVAVVLTEDLELNVDLSDAKEVLDEVFVSGIRVNAQSPITYSNISNEEIENRNLGQDIPSLLNYLPGVVTTSDAGAGIGYTGIRVRGSDGTRINVTINGVPYNDSESQGAFWVNLGDFASSVENLQLQRGVGTSTNGAGAFGASLNFMTDRYELEPSAELSTSFGSYGTRKHTAKFSTGLFNDHWEVAGRISRIKSDGYVDRAFADLESYFLQGVYMNGNTLIKALTFGGSETTYQAWDGIDAEMLEEDRTYNPAGAYVDDNGNPQFYDNHTDNYKQDHYQLLWNQSYANGWSSNLTLHYTRGAGYYESYRPGEALEDYGIPSFPANGEEVNSSDLVTQEWLDNHFYGTTFNVNYKNTDLDFILGGGINKYEGDHFGEIIYARFAPLQEPGQRYYENTGLKTDFNIFAKANYALSDKLALFGDMQLRTTDYEVDGTEEGAVPFIVDDSQTFFNPKAGLTYEMNPANQFYFSFARAHKEPNRNDFKNGNPEPEELNDFELGWRYKTEKVQVNSNFYLMDYHNQLVMTGGIDDTGAFVRENSGNSYRLGLEIDAAILITDKISLRPNIALSRNKNTEFISTWNGEVQNFGDTDISFSPEVVAANIIEYRPIQNLEIALLSKYVGEQFMSNIEAEGSKLESYFVNDINIQYTWKSAPLFQEVVFTGLINNIFNEMYVSNGYFYTYDEPNESLPSGLETFGGAGYYPQAETNFLAGVTLKF